MKRLSVILLLALTYSLCHAQGYIDHIVQRGETLDFLARKYSVTIQDIIDQNEDLDLSVFYVGLPIQIPRPEVDGSNQSVERIIASQSSINSLLNEAYSLYSNGSYKKAAKIYTAAIKDNPSSDLYFLRGRCYLKQGKYKSAVNDLSLARHGSDLSASFRNSCSDLLTDAQDKREAQLEARSEAWGKVFAVAAMATAVVADAAIASTQSAHMQTYSPGNTPSFTGNYELDRRKMEAELNVIAQNTIVQVQAQMEADKQRFLSQFRTSFKQINGREPTEMEELEAYTGYLQAMNEATASTESSTSSSSTTSGRSTTSSSSSTSTSTSTSQSSGKTCLKISATDLAHCNGMKVCSKCNGKKAYWDNSFGNRHYVDPCVICNGTGKCPGCNGTGTKH